MKFTTLAFVALFASFTSVASAQVSVAAIGAMASELGVSTTTLVACASSARDAATGERGTPERRASVHALTLACLQKARPDLTTTAFDAAVAKYMLPPSAPAAAD
jgi:hypothetical protein